MFITINTNNISSCALASPIFVNTELLSLGQLFMISEQEVKRGSKQKLLKDWDYKLTIWGHARFEALSAFGHINLRIFCLKAKGIELKTALQTPHLPNDLVVKIYNFACLVYKQLLIFPQVAGLPEHLAKNLSSIHVCLEVSQADFSRLLHLEWKYFAHLFRFAVTKESPYYSFGQCPDCFEPFLQKWILYTNSIFLRRKE